MSGSSFDAVEARIEQCIRDSAGRGFPPLEPAAFDCLAAELLALQTEYNPVLRRLREHRGLDLRPPHPWQAAVPMPIRAFREAEVTAIPPSERTHEFQSSGTTGQARSRHFHAPGSLRLYELSAWAWFQHHLLHDLAARAWNGLALTPSSAEVPCSSLVHMLDVIARKTGRVQFAARLAPDGAWQLDFDRVAPALQAACREGTPLLLLTTAFGLVHLLEELQADSARWQLPPGSRIMETGGYKGRSRVVPREELLALAHQHLGLSPEWMVSEYGMCELSSQAYTHQAGSPRHESYHFPPWARARIINPENGQPAPEGAAGLLQVFDLANSRSAMAVQTEDVAVMRGGRFELIGRDPHAPARGCSLMIQG